MFKITLNKINKVFISYTDTYIITRIITYNLTESRDFVLKAEGNVEDDPEDARELVDAHELELVAEGVDHALGVVNHVVEGNRHCGLVSCHHIRGRVTDENYIYSSAIHETG